jgi:RNA polymerase sigma factor (sigma-70 family)
MRRQQPGGEHDLLQAIGQEQDKEAWAQLYCQMYEDLFRYLKSRFSSSLDDQEIETIISNAFIKCFQNADSYTGKPKTGAPPKDSIARAWIRKIAYYDALDYVDAISRNEAITDIKYPDESDEHTLDRLESGSLHSRTLTPEDLYQDKEGFSYCWDSLNERQALIMTRFAEGKNGVDIAAELNRTEARISQLKHEIEEVFSQLFPKK